MSVVCHNDYGAVIDQLMYINSMYDHQTTEDNKEDVHYKFNPDLFNIKSQFMNDSQFERLYFRNSDEARIPRNRKKRKLEEMSEGQRRMLEFHSEITDVIVTAMNSLLTAARSKDYLLSITRLGYPEDNNKAAREASRGTNIDLISLTKENTDSKLPLDIHECDSPFNTLVHHKGNDVVVKEILGSKFTFPPNCSFLMSDITNMAPLMDDGKQFDLIVLDPPWFNKSVKRKKKYHMLYDDVILDLPIHRLTKHGSLVVVWATNNQQQQEFVVDTLFPRWNVKYLVRWIWLKVTKHGEPIKDLDKVHNKPYEVLFIGRVFKERTATGLGEDRHKASETKVETPQKDGDGDGNVADGISRSLKNVNSDEKSLDLEKAKIPIIPQNYVLLSIPCSIHSHKPSLNNILAQYLPPNPRCLELFARSLNSGWVSWGNEVLKLQELAYFKQCETV